MSEQRAADERLSKSPHVPAIRALVCRLGYILVFALIAIACGLALRRDVSEFLLERLTHVRHLPRSESTQKDVVYVLGGTPESLKAKFLTASILLRDGKAAQVLVMSQHQLMGFSPALGRNLHAHEWVVENLGAVGIAADTIDFVTVEEGFFGTWSEARSLSRLARERGYRRLILVTSAYHSRRVWDSFSRTLGESGTSLYLYTSNEPAYLRNLLPESAKLLLYRVLLF